MVEFGDNFPKADYLIFVNTERKQEEDAPSIILLRLNPV